MTTLNTILNQRFIPVFHNSNPEKAKKVLQACYDGGCRTVEFTNRGEMAIEVFRELESEASRNMPDLILGAGSVSDEACAGLFMHYGANYLVSQYFDEKIAVVCNKRKIPYLPGCATLSEIHAAETAGVEICKLFPSVISGGPAFVEAILGPSPWTSIMPTHGVLPEEEDLRKWFDAGVSCVGMGTKLIPAEIPDDYDYSLIIVKIRNVIAILNKIFQGNSKHVC